MSNYDAEKDKPNLCRLLEALQVRPLLFSLFFSLGWRTISKGYKYLLPIQLATWFVVFINKSL